MKVALERNESKRRRFIQLIGLFDPEQLTFVDESAIDRRHTDRDYGWGPSGNRVTVPGHFVRGQR
jgi:hypothetical protein